MQPVASLMNYFDCISVHGSRVTFLHLPRKAGPGVVRPAEAGQAAAEGAGYARREKCLNVVEAPGGGAALRGFVEREESLPALMGCAGGGIVQQVGFRREAQQDGHRDAARTCARGWLRQGIAMRHFPALAFPIFGTHIIDIVLED